MLIFNVIFTLTAITILLGISTIPFSYYIKRKYLYRIPAFTNGIRGTDTKKIKQDISDQKVSDLRLIILLKTFMIIDLIIRILSATVLICFIAILIIQFYTK